jgi:hypothetical protein
LRFFLSGKFVVGGFAGVRIEMLTLGAFAIERQ